MAVLRHKKPAQAAQCGAWHATRSARLALDARLATHESRLVSKRAWVSEQSRNVILWILHFGAKILDFISVISMNFCGFREIKDFAFP